MREKVHAALQITIDYLEECVIIAAKIHASPCRNNISGDGKT